MPALIRLTRRFAALLVGVAACRSTQGTAPTHGSGPPSASVALVAPKPTPVAVVPRIGGIVTRGASHSFELVLLRDGLVEVALSDEDGHALNEPLRLFVTPARSDGKSERVELRFTPFRQRFQGHAEHGLMLVSGAVDIEIEHNGSSDRARAESVTVLFGPERGGHMLALGEFGAEVIPHASGRVQAFVRDALGSVVRAPNRVLRATLLTKALERSDVVLRWDPGCACYTGNASSELRPGPLEVTLDGADPPRKGRLQQAALAPEPLHAGRVMLVGFHAVELRITPQLLELFVYDAFGKPYPASHLGVVLAFDVDPKKTLLSLAWDPTHQSYRVPVSGHPELARAVVRVSLTAGERADLGGASPIERAESR